MLYQLNKKIRTRLIPLKIGAQAITPLDPTDPSLSGRILYHKGGNWATSDGYFDFALGKIYSAPGASPVLFVNPTSNLYTLNTHDIYFNNASGYIQLQSMSPSPGIYDLIDWTTTNYRTFYIVIKCSGDNSGGIIDMIDASNIPIDLNQCMRLKYLSNVLTFTIGFTTGYEILTYTTSLISSSFQIIWFRVRKDNVSPSVEMIVNGTKQQISTPHNDFANLSDNSSGLFNFFGNLHDSNLNPMTPSTSFYLADLGEWNFLFSDLQINQVGTWLANKYALTWKII